MKEIVLSVKRQKTEIKIFCVCIALAYLMNIISIIAYGTSWSELWTQSLWMLLITCGFYGLSVVLRLLYYGLSQLSFSLEREVTKGFNIVLLFFHQEKVIERFLYVFD